jgi:hypothetical protein
MPKIHVLCGKTEKEIHENYREWNKIPIFKRTSFMRRDDGKKRGNFTIRYKKSTV